MPATTATREILWNIPLLFQMTMYGLFFLGLGSMIFGLYRKFRSTKTSPDQKLVSGSDGLQWGPFFKTLLLQGKLPRRPHVARFHALIFYSFIILTIATELVAIHSDTPFKVFQGTTYIVISFLADIAGVLILVGLAMALLRRYFQKPTHLSEMHPLNASVVYGTLALLIISGFLVEGFRILGTGLPPGEASYAPIGWMTATILQSSQFSEETVTVLFRSLWMFHMALTMFFIGSIGFSAFSHMVMAPVSALITPKRRGGVLLPMNFDDENAETFGLFKIAELSAKQRFDTMVCVECGRCSESCPALRAGKPLNPKLIITKMRDFIDSEPSNNERNFWEEGAELYSSVEIDSCTTCGACMEECPMNIEHVTTIMELKRYKALTLGDIPSTAGTTIQNIQNTGNPWGQSRDARMDWAEGLDIPTAEAGKKVQYLYYVGCAGSYDPANQKVVKDTTALLKKAGVDFAVMGKTESCNGDPVRRFGDEYSFTEIALENIASINQFEFDTIITQCPHCMHTIGKEYAKFEEGKFNVIHHTELLADLVHQGKLKPVKEIKENFTLHDPCYLGRHHGNYHSPREILNAVPGLKLTEMKESEDKAMCCGMGGGNMWYEVNEGEHVSKKRLEHVAETKAPSLATACSYCMINFNSSRTQVKETEDLIVEDVASLLHRSVMD